MGLAAGDVGDSLSKDITGLVKATIRDSFGIQIISLIRNWQPGLWVNAVVLMQMVNDHSFQLRRVSSSRDR